MAILGVLLAAPIMPAVSQAKTQEKVLLAPSCPRCSIVTERIGRIGGDGGASDDARGFFDLQVLDAGSVLAVPIHVHEVWITDFKGNILKRIGRDGEGPGEFRRPWSAFVGPGDSISIYDRQLARVSLFTLDGTFHRSFRVPAGVNTLLPIGGTQAVVVGRLAAPDVHLADKLSVFPVHLVRGDSVQKSFGEIVRKIDPREGFQMDRILVPYQGSILILNRSYHYTIDRWGPTGLFIGRLVREPQWFPPFEHYGSVNPVTPPSPIIFASWVDNHDQLWVIGGRAAPTWKKAIADQPSAGEGGSQAFRILRPDLYLEGFVEVIDLRLQTLVATATLPIEAHYALGKGVVGVVKDDATAGKYLELYRLRLKVP
jgi:hypothetical protein